jgi:predicted nuclease of predicted toxin-antitoxin system
MDIKDQKSIDTAYKIIQAKYLQKNLAKIIHEREKGLKTAHAKEVVALNKAKDDAVKAKEIEIHKKYLKVVKVGENGRIIPPIVAGNLTSDQIAINRYLESKGQKPYYVTGKEPWKKF